MEYHILGPVEVLDHGDVVKVGPRQQRALLLMLLLNRNRVVSTERIVERLWPDDSTDKERTLWVYISRLRTALEPHREAHAKSSVLVTQDHGYLLRASDAQLDAHRFEQLVTEGSQLLVDEPERAARVLRDGLELWRGEALQDFVYDDFARADAARLEELRLVAIENRVDADVRIGRHRDLVGELEQLVLDHPYRERLVSLQMVTLYRAGRHADALRAFQRYRRAIGDDVGLEPSPEIRRLEEQVLLHDERLAPSGGSITLDDAAASVPNPFKGLHAFTEEDESTFFGRERLVADIVRRIDGGARLVALVGASGSGKSSVLDAGLVPAIRRGAVDDGYGGGSDGWRIAKMVPGARPFREAEAALLRSTLDAPESFGDLLDDPEDGLLRACFLLAGNDRQRVLIVIDQFEELFTLGAVPGEVARFIRNLEVVLNDPHGRIVVALGLRADFYGMPLEYPHFAQLLGEAIVNVVPLLPDELEAAAEEPALAAGAQLEPALMVQLLGDVAGNVGALPVFQYALTELFDRRQGATLTLAAYNDLGGVSGALARRAEELFLELDTEERGAAQQLFLRLVTVGEHTTWSRRRLPASEIVTVAADVVALQTVLHRFSAHRLVTFDRDHVSGSSTVEVAHEALIARWPRLREWIEESQRDLRRHAQFVVALHEWSASGGKTDYLLSGERLADYEQWATVSTLRLTIDEERFLRESIAHRAADRQAERERVAHEVQLDRRARRRLWGLVPGVLAILAILVAATITLLRDGEPSIAVVHGVSGDLGITDMMIAGVGAAERDREIGVDLVEPLVDPEADLRRLAESGAALIVVGSEFDAHVARVAPEFDDVHWVAIDPVVLHLERSNISEMHFAVEDSAFVAGAVAALSTETGKVGFIGGLQSIRTEATRAGFERGVAWEDPDVHVRSVFIGPVANPLADAETREDLAHEVASAMYAEGVDVILHDAGAAGAGVLRAARESSSPARHLWTIGSDVDEYITVSDLDRRHVLTSTIKRVDTAVESAITSYLDGSLREGDTVLGLGEDGVALSRSGGQLTAIDGPLTNLEGEIGFGHVAVSALSTRPPEWQIEADVTVDLTLSDDGCRIDTAGAPLVDDRLPLDRGSVVAITMTNQSSQIGGLAVHSPEPGIGIDELRRDAGQESPNDVPDSFGSLQTMTLVELGATTGTAARVTGAPLVVNCLFWEPDLFPFNFPTLIVSPT